MEFLECVKLYANKPANSVVNTAINKRDPINWNERLQTIRRVVIDQLSRLKIEEACLRNLALKVEPPKRPHSTANNEQDDLLMTHRKRLCVIPSNNFDIDITNQIELDLDPLISK